jgi:hypothetical protein
MAGRTAKSDGLSCIIIDSIGLSGYILIAWILCSYENVHNEIVDLRWLSPARDRAIYGPGNIECAAR